MPPTHPSLADVAAAYRTLIAHETEPKEQDFYRTRLQRLGQATESVCEFDCRSRVAAAGVGVYCPQCSAKCADTDLAAQLAKAIRAAWVDRLDWDELAQGALEFLTSTGRLLAADGLVLAGAEKAALERLLAAQTGIVSRDVYEAIECLRALFPATEPAEDAPCAICNVNETNHAGVSYYHPFTTELGPFDNEGNDRPAPAEPAEEETKADPWIVQLPEGMTMEQWIESLPDEAPGLLAAVREVRERLGISSPVVPAPTETEWQTWQEVPEGRTVQAKNRHTYTKRDGILCIGTSMMKSCMATSTQHLAPFVAAEEG